MQSKCKCGRQVVEINTPEHNTINCHCSLYRKNYGSAYSTWVTVAVDKVSLPKDESGVKAYAVGDSGTSFFCKNCGATVYVTDKRYPNIVAFLAGTLDGMDIKPPAADYFYSHRAEWLTAEDAREKFGGDSGFEQLVDRMINGLAGF